MMTSSLAEYTRYLVRKYWTISGTLQRM